LHRLFPGRRLRLPARVAIVIGGFLALPGTAAAHSGAPTVALDFRLRVSQATRALRGVRPAIVDGDRGLRLDVDPPATLVVLGDLQEPMIRFDSRGVWVDRRSPTAAGAKLIRASTGSGASWSLVSHGHGLRWHDHRLAPPVDLRSGSVARWSIPVELDGRRTAIAGTVVRVSRPPAWPWALGAVALAAVATVLAWRLPGARARLLVVLGVLAAFGALAASTSFATADEISGAGEWIEVGVVAALLALGVLSLRQRWSSLRIWAAAGIGVVAATFSVGSLGVFSHGYVISTLPAAAARLAVLLAVVAGMGTALLSVSVGIERIPVRPPPAPQPQARTTRKRRRRPRTRGGSR
jgi:hypothetical protein